MVRNQTYKLDSIILMLCLAISFAMTGQQITVTGLVTGNDIQEPLIGVNVLIKDSDQGTTSDIDGRFELLVDIGATLQISYLGYETKEIIVTESDLSVELMSQAAKLDQVVVVGYGTSRKRDLTGSVVSIRSEDIQAVPIVSADQALQGRAAGVFVQQNSGEPGAGTTIRIRGTSSISAGNEPLYVIDGVPILTRSGDLSTGAAKGPSINPLSTISPNDIAGIEVLKDASAAAIYGARGANGVVLITTKRGEAGKSKMDFNFYQGFQEIRKKYQLLDGSQFAHFTNEASFNGGNGRVYSDPSRFGKGTDWQDVLLRTAPQSNYELAFSGGTQEFQYALSGSYYTQDGIIVGSTFDRYNLRANLDGQVHKRIKISNNLMVSHTRSDKIASDDNGAFDGGTFTAALSYNPLVPVRDASGNFVQKNYAVDNDGQLIDGSQSDNSGKPIAEKILSTAANPLLKAIGSPSEAKITRIIDNLIGTIDLIEGLNLKISLGGDFTSSRSDQFTPKATRSGGETFATSATGTSLSLLNENTLNYKNTFGDHTLSGVVGVSAQKTRLQSINITATNFNYDQFGYDNYEIAEGVSLGTNFTDFSFLSGLGRINYSYKNKYLVTLTGRADGSSKFGANNKWGFFPSASIAWVASEENFVQDLSFMEFLKFRLSYGVIGNESIGPYLSQAILVPVDIAFNDVLTIGFEPFIFPNSNLRWESTAQLNFGMDASFNDGRLSLTADYYKKSTFDLLLTTDVPFYTGYASVFSNVGDLENEGVELSITGRPSFGDLNWSTSFNLSFNKNTVTSLADRDNIPNSGAGLFGIESWALLREGEEVGQFYGLLTDGIVQLGDDRESIPRFQGQAPLSPGERKFKDLNGDGVLSAEDRTFIGEAQPDFTFGWNNSFTFRGFELSMFLQGVYGNKIVNFNKFLVERTNGLSNVTLDFFANRWTPENPTNRYPKVDGNPAFTRRFISDAEVEDGSYLRLKTITFGYRIPSAFLQKYKISGCRLYATGKNILTFTDYSGYDPEVSHFGGNATNMGADLGGYPNNKSILVGINLSF